MDETACCCKLAQSPDRARAIGRRIGPGPKCALEFGALRAVAAGRSNAKIAAALVLSVHTVERHVANVYRKISVHNRAEATAYALRAGLD